MPRSLLLLLILCGVAAAEEIGIEFGGHTKLRLIGQGFPGNSLFRPLAGAQSFDLESELRLVFSVSRQRWNFDADYQLFALYGDSIEWARELGAGTALFADRLPGDDRRLFDLTRVFHDDGKVAMLHRLDRFALTYTGEKTVVRVGRQALSWGNGLFYAPMDLVNPFDPAAIDTEFKAGDDMLYLQHLLDDGDDLQAAFVFRRDPLTGDVDSGEATATLKYHGFAGDREYDLLIADSHGDLVLGAGGVQSIGGAILRGDIVVTDARDDVHIQLVANFSYSWLGRPERQWHDRVFLQWLRATSKRL